MAASSAAAAASKAPARTQPSPFEDPQLLFIIKRSKNLNVVCYRAMLSANKETFAEPPIEVFWLDIDPEYVKANRAKGKMTDREELGTIEWRMAYGVSADKAGPNRFRLHLVALPEREVFMVLDNEGRPRATLVIDGVECYLAEVYVESQDRMFGLPKVLHIDLTGVALDGSGTKKERINKA